jgi:hypothetical protein
MLVGDKSLFLIATTNYVNYKLLKILLNKKKYPKILGGLTRPKPKSQIHMKITNMKSHNIEECFYRNALHFR